MDSHKHNVNRRITDRRVADKRVHDNLREMVDDVCKGILPHLAERIKKAARTAYYLGVLDGIQIERDKQEQEKNHGSG